MRVGDLRFVLDLVRKHSQMNVSSGRSKSFPRGFVGTVCLSSPILTSNLRVRAERPAHRALFRLFSPHSCALFLFRKRIHAFDRSRTGVLANRQSLVLPRRVLPYTTVRASGEWMKTCVFSPPEGENEVSWNWL